MSTTTYATIAVCVMLAAGCTSTPEVQKGVTEQRPDGTVITRSDYAAALEEAGKQRPLFELQCPPTGCQLAGLKVYNPQAANLPAPPQEPESLATTVVKELFGTARQFGPWAAGAFVMDRAFKAASPSNTSTYTSVTRDSGNTTNTSTATSTINQTTTTTTTNSNNTQRTCNGGGASGTTGATAGGASC